jgi:hypothetical protein
MSNRPIGVNIYLSVAELAALEQARTFLANLAERPLTAPTEADQANHGMNELFQKIDAARQAQSRKAGIRSGIRFKGQADSGLGQNQGTN